MAIVAGKNTVVKVSVDGTTYYTVAETNEVERSFTVNNEDVSVFGDSFVDRASTLKDVTYSLSGFSDTTDTNGQLAIINSFLNSTPIYIQVLFNGTNGYKQLAIVESYSESSSPDANVTFSAELAGKGVVPTVVP
jgi:predicted secreted protein